MSAHILIVGAGGRMGKMLVQTVDEDPNAQVSGATEITGHPAIGTDAGINAGIKKLGVTILDSMADCCGGADVIIEFSSPECTMDTLTAAVACKKPLVIGTTGLKTAQLDKITQAAKTIPILKARNFSIAITLLLSVVAEIAEKLGPEYDVEIVEAHHHHKKDAPSGTAQSLAESIAAAKKLNLDSVKVSGRQGMVGARKKNEIGILSVRGGDVVGDHTVGFYGTGERIEIKHQAHSRTTFAQGAVRAALWLIGKSPGLYSMRDVLGLS